MINPWLEKIDKCSAREKLLILLVLMAFIYLSIEMVVLKPIYVGLSVEKSILAQKQSTLEKMTQVIEVDASSVDTQKQQLQNEIADMQAQINGQQGQTYFGVNAKDMVLILSALIKQSDNINLLSISNLESSQLEEQLVYRHPIEMKYEGKFHAIVDYLQMLENLNLPIAFESMSYSVLTHPNASMHIRFDFISQSQEFVEF